MLLRIVRLSRLMAIVLVVGFGAVILGGAGHARAQSGVIVGSDHDATIRLGKMDPSSGNWVSLPSNAQASIQFKNDRGNRFLLRYYSLPPGKYGVVFLSEGNTNYHGRMLASGSGGAGGTYAHALAEFSVGAGEVVDAGYISGWVRSANPNDATAQIFAMVPKGARLVKRQMVIRR